MLAPDSNGRLEAREAARADLCRFIAACYYEPGPEFAEERLFETMALAASHVDDELAALANRLGEAFAAIPLQELLVDHARLFLGPVQALARPYASVWLTGENQVMRRETLDVVALYAEAGFEVEEAFNELPDHVAAELEFLYLLLFREREARSNGDESTANELLGLKQRFFSNHLLQWIGGFLLAMHAGAQTTFYETLAELTERFIHLEKTRRALPTDACGVSHPPQCEAP